jgi:uncharacterized membrane protein YbaN (DUF454 family)
MLAAIKKSILIITGSLLLTIGAIGIFLPLLPTTPFLLLAVYCYFRSSKRLHDWLMSNKVLGAYIYNYITYKALLRSTKISTMITLWAGLTVSMILIKSWWIIALLIVIGIGVSIHVLTLKTICKSELKRFDPSTNRINKPAKYTENIYIN